MKKEFMMYLLELSDLLEKEIKMDSELGNATKRINYETPTPYMHPEKNKINTNKRIITVTLQTQIQKNEEMNTILKQESDNYNIITGMDLNASKLTHQTRKDPKSSYFNLK